MANAWCDCDSRLERFKSMTTRRMQLFDLVDQHFDGVTKCIDSEVPAFRKSNPKALHYNITFRR
jgi:hypothetical protein